MRRVAALLLALAACTDEHAAAERYRAAWCAKFCNDGGAAAGCTDCPASGAGGGAANGGGTGQGGGAAQGGGGEAPDGGDLPSLKLIVGDGGMQTVGTCVRSRLIAVASNGGGVDVGPGVVFSVDSFTLFSSSDCTAGVPKSAPVALPDGGLTCWVLLDAAGPTQVDILSQSPRVLSSTSFVEARGQASVLLNDTVTGLCDTFTPIGVNPFDGGLIPTVAPGDQVYVSDLGGAAYAVAAGGSCSPPVPMPIHLGSMYSCVLSGRPMHVEGPYLAGVDFTPIFDGGALPGQTCDPECTSRLCQANNVCACVAPMGECLTATACCSGVCSNSVCL